MASETVSTGQLRQRVQIQAPTETSDSQGGQVVTWPSTLATVWACIRPLAGQEAIEASKMTSTISHRVTIRYSDTVSVVTPKYRLVYGSRTFQITSVEHVEERGWWLNLLCMEVQS